MAKKIKIKHGKKKRCKSSGKMDAASKSNSLPNRISKLLISTLTLILEEEDDDKKIFLGDSHDKQRFVV